MTFALHGWHLFVVLSGLVVVWAFKPVPNDAYGAGTFLKLIAGAGLIPSLWLIYFAGRFFIG